MTTPEDARRLTDQLRTALAAPADYVEPVEGIEIKTGNGRNYYALLTHGGQTSKAMFAEDARAIAEDLWSAAAEMERLEAESAEAPE